MQKKLIVCAVLAACSALPSLAAAETTFTGNMALSTEYIYRGIAQSNRKPAISGGFDFVHESGFYVGNWNSSISWLSDAGGGNVSAPIEMDGYFGYKGSITDSLAFDIGDLYYYYPGTFHISGYTKPDTNEIYAALTFGPVTLKYSYSTTNLFGTLTPTGKKTDGSGYVDLSYTGDLGNGLTLGAHVGHQDVKDFSDASYTDYKLSITKDFSGYGVSLAYVDTDAKGGPGQFYRSALPFNKDLGKSTVVLSVSKSF